MEVSRQRKAYLYWKANKENIRQRIITNFNLDKDWKGIKQRRNNETKYINLETSTKKIW